MRSLPQVIEYNTGGGNRYACDDLAAHQGKMKFLPCVSCWRIEETAPVTHPAANSLTEGYKPEPLNALPEDDKLRSQYALADGLLDYFPNALAEVAKHSLSGSVKHNGNVPPTWARCRSTDHRNKIVRHAIDAGGRDAEGHRHSAALAWRALALLQEELERDEGYPPSRASKFGAAGGCEG